MPKGQHSRALHLSMNDSVLINRNSPIKPHGPSPWHYHDAENGFHAVGFNGAIRRMFQEEPHIFVPGKGLIHHHG